MASEREVQVSPLEGALPFAVLRPHYPRAEMVVVLTQRMVEVHPRMPQLRLDPDEIEAFLDYWVSLPPAGSPAARP